MFESDRYSPKNYSDIRIVPVKTNPSLWKLMSSTISELFYENSSIFIVIITEILRWMVGILTNLKANMRLGNDEEAIVLFKELIQTPGNAVSGMQSTMQTNRFCFTQRSFVSLKNTWWSSYPYFFVQMPLGLLSEISMIR